MKPKIELIITDKEDDSKIIRRHPFDDIAAAVAAEREVNDGDQYDGWVYVNDELLPIIPSSRKVFLDKFGLPYVPGILDKEEDNSIDSMLHLGKSLAQWEKDFKGEFSKEQIYRMIKGGCDLQKMLMLGLDEADKKEDDAAETKQVDESKDESNDVESIEKLNETELDGEINGDFMSVKDLERIGKHAYPHSANGWMTDTIVGIVNGKSIDFSGIKYLRADTYPTEGTFFLMDDSPESLKKYNELKKLMLNENKSIYEGRGWYRGGYGGTGRSYSSLGREAPRGAAISWFNVDQLDPKAAGKMYGWRCGPSNFPFEDLLYPNRKYKVGTMVMRNKYVKAGSMSGEKYIAIPSYFDALKNNDEAAIGLLNALKIPLDLTFGMDPNDDYSMTYVEK